MSKETYIPLGKYQRLTGLSDRALVHLLCSNKLSCRCDEEQGILVDFESVDNKELLEAVAKTHAAAVGDIEVLMAEKFGSFISEKFEEISSEAISLYLQRLENESSS